MNISVIQGGMGIGVSNWKLARAVSMMGELGVVSGTGIASVFIRELQDGDGTGSRRRALNHFPDQKVAQRMLDTYYLPEGERGDRPYLRHPMFALRNSSLVNQVMAAACFSEVFLAKEGHEGVVGINFLEKIVMGNLPGLYGAMLAGVDAIIMGAGIPREIPGVLDELAQHKPARLKVPVEGSKSEHFVEFDPVKNMAIASGFLKRPKFFPVVSSATLANHLLKKSTGQVDGFIIEYPVAGGHNAPPRGKMNLDSRGEPIYSDKDSADLEQIKRLGLPFWLAGEFATPDKLALALQCGAQGVQVGTAFAFCEESGLAAEYKKQILDKARNSEPIELRTDPLASPSGYPFKVVSIKGTISEQAIYQARPRKCDLGYLRQAYLTPDKRVGYRCPSEPVEDYVRKGGELKDTEHRKCLCNGLTAAVGLPQLQEEGYTERPILTAGKDIAGLARYLPGGRETYSAGDVLRSLKGSP